MSEIDEILYDYWARHHYCKDGCQSGDPKSEITKQALYKDMYEIISYSADRADAYTKLKEYFGVKDD